MKLMMEIHKFTSHKFSSGEEYFIFNKESIVRMCIEDFQQLHPTPPRQMIRVHISGSTVTRSITDCVSDNPGENHHGECCLYDNKLQEWEELSAVNRWKAAGHHVEVIPLILFSDDVSGNISKKWNKFDVWAMMFAGLPRAINSHLENIHFLCASNKVDCLEMANALVGDLNVLERDGILLYDAFLKKEVIVIAPVICAIADNPRASDIVSHSGNSAVKYCRICEVGAAIALSHRILIIEHNDYI